MRCRVCGAKTTHTAVVRATTPEELRRARLLGRATFAVGLALVALSAVFLARPLRSLVPDDPANLLAAVIGWLGFILLRALVLGERGQMLHAFGEYFEWECEVCGKVRRGL